MIYVCRISFKEIYCELSQSLCIPISLTEKKLTDSNTLDGLLSNNHLIITVHKNETSVVETCFRNRNCCLLIICKLI